METAETAGPALFLKHDWEGIELTMCKQYLINGHQSIILIKHVLQRFQRVLRVQSVLRVQVSNPFRELNGLFHLFEYVFMGTMSFQKTYRRCFQKPFHQQTFEDTNKNHLPNHDVNQWVVLVHRDSAIVSALMRDVSGFY